MLTVGGELRKGWRIQRQCGQSLCLKALRCQCRDRGRRCTPSWVLGVLFRDGFREEGRCLSWLGKVWEGYRYSQSRREALLAQKEQEGRERKQLMARWCRYRVGQLEGDEKLEKNGKSHEG